MDKKVFYKGVLIGVVCSTAVNFLVLLPLGGLRRPPPPPWSMPEQVFVKNFSKHMGIRPEQMDRAGPLIQKFHSSMLTVRRAQVEELISGMAKLEESLSGVLDEEQKERISRRRKHLEGLRSDPRRFPPPPF